MYKVITIEREYGCGAGGIARQLARRLDWKLWDQALTEEIAKLAQVDCAEVERCQERVESRFYRMARIFWRGSYEKSMVLPGSGSFDADQMVEIGQRVMEDAADAGKCVIVGRGAPYFLRQQPNIFHVFLYAPRAEKIRRTCAMGKKEAEAEELVDTIDQERMLFVKHYFGADWPTRSLYHLMINTAIGDENVISTILNTMQIMEQQSGSKVTDYHDGSSAILKSG